MNWCVELGHWQRKLIEWAETVTKKGKIWSGVWEMPPNRPGRMRSVVVQEARSFNDQAK